MPNEVTGNRKQADGRRDDAREPYSPGAHRPRRLRVSETMRALVRETRLDPSDLILPLFVTHGNSLRRPIESMPGVCRLSVDEAVAEARRVRDVGVPAILLFGIPERKDEFGTEAYAPDGIIQRAVREITAAVPDLIVCTDVCMCEYTDHGHCGVLDSSGIVRNDDTLEYLQRIAVSHAEAGAHVVAPSGMIDGMVGAIRSALDLAGAEHVSILSYAVKYASGFYGPFRDAAEGAPKFGDRKTHQMDPANAAEAIREARLDVDQGADMLMVKPALSYLDVIRDLKASFPEYPLIAYNVSGEYSMVKAAARNGWLDERACTLELLTSMKRAGATAIITYSALEVARWLMEK